MKKTIIAHAHIFKNAGTTIDWILERNFGSGFQDDRDDTRMRKEREYIFEVLKAKPKLRALSSHSLRLPVPSSDVWDVHTIVMLRDPMLRVRSVYDFERKQVADTPGAQNAKRMNIAEYVAWRLQDDVAPTIRNMQIRYLTSNSMPQRFSPTSEYLEEAISFVEKNPLIGVVELFDESVVLFSEHFSKTEFEIDFSYQKQNVSRARAVSREERLAELESDLGAELYARLMSANELDMQLYEFTKAAVVKRFELVDGADQKLDDLRSACRALA
ncbi:sulfotransferase family 2 domain-containing protein [Arenicella xantha]|uniref:sulfotransferase family 2 domain-containing protein n=1 Tax=Arenicella xantha TaxID=644221 RepID=UPI0014738BAD|nr:sulfotransferase family 2 domain-containing protein [Arenicella xantha]